MLHVTGRTILNEMVEVIDSRDWSPKCCYTIFSLLARLHVSSHHHGPMSWV